MDLVRRVTTQRLKKRDFPQFKAGDELKVSVRVSEANKTRIQIFKGRCLKVQNGGRQFTVRKISGGVGVERTFAWHSPVVEKIEVEKRARVRRARLFYLRALKGRAARLSSINN